MSSHRHQTYPAITLRYVADEVTGLLVWTLNVTDGDNAAAPVTITPATAAAIAETIDVALPTPIMVGGEPTSAQRIVLAAHVQTLAAELAVAEADLRATAPARSTTAARAVPPREPVPVITPVAAAFEPVAAEPAAKPVRHRNAAKKSTPAVVLVPVVLDAPIAGEQDEEPDLGEPLTAEPDAPAVEQDEPPRQYEEAPEFLPRSNHLVVPDVAEF